MERTYGHFIRNVTLREEVDPGQAIPESEDGVLKVHMATSGQC